jgi:hypothetical protein
MHAILRTKHLNKQSLIGSLNAHAYTYHGCEAKFRPVILCIIGAPNHTQTLLAPSPTHSVHFIELTYCHDTFPGKDITHKHTKYDSLINIIQKNGWKTNPLMTITTWVTGAIHKHSIKTLTKLIIPKTNIKTQNS